jgi:hypothetical protein
MVCLRGASNVKKYEEKNLLFASLKSKKKEVGSGSGSISQRYGSGDPDPHQNVTDPHTDGKCITVFRI